MLAASKLDSTWLDVGSRKQFFFDDLMLEHIQDVTRRHHRPTRITAEPLIVKDQPWENILLCSCNGWNIIRDPVNGLFKCWYEDWMVTSPADLIERISPADGKVCYNFHEAWPSRLCYAESDDGVTWRKPGLDYWEEDGRKTNVVLGRPGDGLIHCPYVFLDEGDPDPHRRYKLFFEFRRTTQGNDMTGEGAFRLATSADGISWTISENPIRFGTCGPVLGDVLCLARDPETGIYWANNRHKGMCSSAVHDQRKPTQRSWMPGAGLHRLAASNRRRVFRSQSVDLFNWTTPQPLVVPDLQWDNIDDEFYGMEQFQVGQDWLGILNVFHGTDNHLDVHLTHSRNGVSFTRIQPGRPWLTPSGESGSWYRFETTCPSKPIVVDDELFFYFSGANCHHDWWIVGAREGLSVPEATELSMVQYGIGLARIKQDQFVSISSAQAREGLVVTPAVHASGNHLVLNARITDGGMVRVALADGQDRVLQGFTKDDCVPMTQNSVAHRIRWKGNLPIDTSQPLKIHLYLRQADLFSYQFVGDTE